MCVATCTIRVLYQHKQQQMKTIRWNNWNCKAQNRYHTHRLIYLVRAIQTPTTPMKMPNHIKTWVSFVSCMSSFEALSPCIDTALQNMSVGTIKTTTVPSVPPPTATTTPRSLNTIARAVMMVRRIKVKMLRLWEVRLAWGTTKTSNMASRKPRKMTGYVKINENPTHARQVEARISLVE